MKYLNKNIFEDFDNGVINVILHQENVVSKGFAGIAKTIHDKYPSTLPRNNRKFGMIESTEVEEDKYIVNMYSQFFTGSPNSGKFFDDSTNSLLEDNFEQRINALKQCLHSVESTFVDKNIRIPLIASRLARLNGYDNMSDLEYFKKFIAPVVENILPNINVYYL